MIKRLLILLLLSYPVFAQNTNLSATITDSTSQVWANGSFSVLFIPTPGQPGPFYWQGSRFYPQTYTGTMNGSGVMSVTLPDTSTITPAGSQWQFSLCPNATAPCTLVTTPVTGASEDFSSLFSSRVTPPNVFAAPLPRAYSNAEVPNPPPLQGGQYWNVTNSEACFWNGSAWLCIATGGTVTSVGLALPSSVFNVTGSPVTGSGTLTGAFKTQTANTVFAGPASGSAAAPTFRALVAADIAGILPSFYYQTFQSNGTPETQETAANFLPRFSLGTASGATTVDLATVGTAGTYTNPASVTFDAYGRETAATNGPSGTWTYVCTSAATGCYEISPTGHIHEWGHITGESSNTCFFITFPHVFTNASTIVPSVSDDFGSGANVEHAIANSSSTCTSGPTTTGMYDRPSSFSGSGENGAWWTADGN